ncbi:hypothetical protein BCR42DRAFT_409534 [Absidia repens]|uniref:WWE domain-containing protein n=1 Tax=Absidia repens TaxID=90262 RepID=A0A1X2IRD7_9FUNG|nr:hypothetical protein BCR42DRAFT_409534 [Absidia repens]
MGASIRNMFTFNKKSHRSQQKQKQQDKSRESSLSPSSSVASFSTMSTSEQDIRGIFRTLEPYWSFYHPQQHYWCHFDMDQTMALEQHYQGGRTKHMTLALHDESGSSCTVHFYQQQQQQQLKDGGLHFVMGKTLHRTVAPVWWFEQDLPDGSKGMCRFEHKNQVRLEALSEDRTRLSLVDSGLENASTTVIMTSNGQEEQQEEMRGLLYVHAHPPPMHSLDQKLQDIYSPSTINVATGPFDMAILQRRGSI